MKKSWSLRMLCFTHNTFLTECAHDGEEGLAKGTENSYRERCTEKKKKNIHRKEERNTETVRLAARAGESTEISRKNPSQNDDIN